VSDRPSGRVAREPSFVQATGHSSRRNANDSSAHAHGQQGKRSYLSAGRLAVVSESLSERDWQVLHTLARIRVATGDQLERLHFGGNGVTSRQARRVLSRLVEQRLLGRLDRRIGGVRAGSSGFVYALDIAGQRLIQYQRNGHGNRQRRPWTPGVLFLRHSLAVTELSVQLVEAERRHSFIIDGFTTEPACWREFPGPGGARVVLKPDAHCLVGHGEYQDHFFIEVDRATCSSTTLGRKLELYRQYWSSGREQTQCGVFPRVLWLVPDPARQAQLAGVVQRQPAEAQPLFRIALYEKAVSVMTGEPP
jgi:hypothetical protein